MPNQPDNPNEGARQRKRRLILESLRASETSMRAIRLTHIGEEEIYRAALVHVEHAATAYSQIDGQKSPKLLQAAEDALSSAEQALTCIIEAYCTTEILRTLQMQNPEALNTDIALPDKRIMLPGVGLLLEWQRSPLH